VRLPLSGFWAPARQGSLDRGHFGTCRRTAAVARRAGDRCVGDPMAPSGGITTMHGCKETGGA
jgi:hypothetical protein